MQPLIGLTLAGIEVPALPEFRTCRLDVKTPRPPAEAREPRITIRPSFLAAQVQTKRSPLDLEQARPDAAQAHLDATQARRKIVWALLDAT
jgi:hypothetical protein